MTEGLAVPDHVAVDSTHRRRNPGEDGGTPGKRGAADLGAQAFDQQPAFGQLGQVGHVCPALREAVSADPVEHEHDKTGHNQLANRGRVRCTRSRMAGSTGLLLSQMSSSVFLISWMPCT